MIMSSELMDFSDQIDELFDQATDETDSFWEELSNLFI
ncbi:hypothetical protein MuYL_2112 [Mucilaginibacter xinganensis]|uniref:Uncharacterized protein n=1 Tax=Mucilaginibacter xinganensis TaxID=1234841 RepID=A0A223NVV3_9SPHI|nr:hypothetical protein MuYL_2112 [Mucilaginibacter xinganensis]